MASETYFAVGDRVRYHPDWYNAEWAKTLGLNEADLHVLVAMTGTVIEVDDSARECAYYTVAWTKAAPWSEDDARLFFDADLDANGHLTTCEQSDALVAA